jgi:hypothetical protein
MKVYLVVVGTRLHELKCFWLEVIRRRDKNAQLGLPVLELVWLVES